MGDGPFSPDREYSPPGWGHAGGGPRKRVTERAMSALADPDDRDRASDERPPRKSAGVVHRAPGASPERERGGTLRSEMLAAAVGAASSSSPVGRWDADERRAERPPPSPAVPALRVVLNPT
eukprot:6281445-Prymnesium_polylepis.1